MSTAQQGFALGMSRNSAAFVRFALDVVDLVLSNNDDGVDQDKFLQVYFHGNPPTGQKDRDAWWEEFKNARDYSNQCFNRAISPWAMIRARPGYYRGHYLYHVVARHDGDRTVPEGNPATMSLLDGFTDRRWHTQTQSRQRVRASRALRLIQEGLASNDQGIIDEGKGLLSDILVLSPGLAAVNFDTGLVITDLEQLMYSRDPHIRFLNSQVSAALRSGKQFQKDVDQIVYSVLRLKDIYSKGSLKAMP